MKGRDFGFIWFMPHACDFIRRPVRMTHHGSGFVSKLLCGHKNFYGEQWWR
jgi:hypothetical protein